MQIAVRIKANQPKQQQQQLLPQLQAQLQPQLVYEILTRAAFVVLKGTEFALADYVKCFGQFRTTHLIAVRGFGAVKSHQQQQH